MDKVNKDTTSFADASAVKTDVKTAETKAEVKPSWDHINTDLKSALDTWSDLTDKLANKISPEEEQLREIKNILGSLRDKLKEFSEEATLPKNQEKPPKDSK